MRARYEGYPSLSLIGDYLPRQLEEKEEHAHAQAIRGWSQSDGGLSAQSCVSAVGAK